MQPMIIPSKMSKNKLNCDKISVSKKYLQKKLLHTLSRSRVKTIHVFFVNTNTTTRQLICKKEKSHFLMKYDKLEIFQSIVILDIP